MRAVDALSWAAIASGLGTAACTQSAIAGEAPPRETMSASSEAPVLPRPAGSFSPSHVATDGPGIDGNVVTETESCSGCHPDAAAQWRTSVHAFGSFNNPIYRVVVDRFRREVGKEQSRFCGGCHDIALLVDGAMTADNEIEATDFRGHGGITCRVCHTISEARADGNGSYTMTAAPIPIPKEGDRESVRLHKEHMALAPLRTGALCGSCHRAFLTELTGNAAHLVGQDELGQWSQSIYAGSVAARVDEPIAPKDCRACHMPLEDAPLGDIAAKNGKIASHRFLGAHTWLAGMRGDREQLRRMQERLHGVASIDVAAAVHADGTRALPAESAEIRPGEALSFEVVVRNVGVGHRFPAGTLDAQDTWIELTVHDVAGRLLAEAGTEHEKSGDDATAHRLRAVQVDEQGQPLLTRETNRFRAAVYNHTIPARDAEVVRFRFDVPKSMGARALPLRVTARLRHRSRNLALQRLVCAESHTERGRAFTSAVRERTGSTLDPCLTQPVTDIATREIAVGAATAGPNPVPLWRRLYDHGLGELRALQEEVGDARPSLERALAELPSDSHAERGMIMALLASVAERQGRTEEVLSWLEQAGELLGAHPALSHIRGEAFSSVWRWQEAVQPLRDAALASPRDDRLWMHLALATGSAGRPLDALDAARRALALQPRDPDCLRIQALALQSIHAPADATERAEQAYLDFRAPDDGPRVRAACSKRVPGCALERVPVHAHVMRAERPL